MSFANYFMISFQLEVMSRPPILVSELKLKSEQNTWKIFICDIDLWIVKEHNGQQHLEAII